MHASSGTRGQADARRLHPRRHRAVGRDVRSRAGRGRRAVRGDVVHNAYGYGLFTGGLGLHYGAERMGAMVVPASGGNTAAPGAAACRSRRQDPLLHAVVRAAHRRHDRGGRDRSARAGAGATASSAPSRGRARCATRSSDALGLRALDIYGLSEIDRPGRCERVRGADEAPTSARTTSSSRSSIPERARPCRTATRASWCSRA